jgi:hypothetical protein
LLLILIPECFSKIRPLPHCDAFLELRKTQDLIVFIVDEQFNQVLQMEGEEELTGSSRLRTKGAGVGEGAEADTDTGLEADPGEASEAGAGREEKQEQVKHQEHVQVWEWDQIQEH